MADSNPNPNRQGSGGPNNRATQPQTRGDAEGTPARTVRQGNQGDDPGDNNNPEPADTDILDTVDGFTGKVMLPVGALLTSIFIGWKADTNLLRTTTGLSPLAFGIWRFLLAWLCPLAVAIILVTGLFPAILGS